MSKAKEDRPRVLDSLATMKTKRKKKKITDSSSSSNTTDTVLSDLHATVVKVAVAQICKSVGYIGAQSSALQTLTSVAVRYLESLAKSAATSATSTGRTQCNLYDVIRALEDLHSNVGFHGISNPRRRLYTLSDSSILRDTMKFVYLTDEIPFAKPLPRRCYTLPPNPACLSDLSAKWNHIPRWLPDFPKITGVGGNTVVPALIEDETACERGFLTTGLDREISKLPEKRKKVSFRIRGGGGGRNVIEMESGVDLRMGICKGGKRILCQIYDEDDDDDEKFVNASCSSNHNPEPKIKCYMRKKKKKMKTSQEQI